MSDICRTQTSKWDMGGRGELGSPVEYTEPITLLQFLRFPPSGSIFHRQGGGWRGFMPFFLYRPKKFLFYYYIMTTKNFTNELGRKIKVIVKKTKAYEYDHQKKEEVNFPAINLKILGPISQYENIMTIKEAEEVYNALKIFLKK